MNEYMYELRKLVGHRAVVQCGASAVCIDADGRILLGRRADNHQWTYSGGSVEIDEYVEDCARRELKEEMGLIAEELELFFINSGPEAHYVYPNGDEVSNIEIVYLCRKFSGTPEAKDGEMEELRFFERDEIDLGIISPPVLPVIKKLLGI